MLITDKESFKRLCKLNQLRLTETEETAVMEFFKAKNDEFAVLDKIDTENTLRMVHVMPMETVVREDKMIKLFTRDELQASAPESYDGYWQVPRLVE